MFGSSNPDSPAAAAAATASDPSTTSNSNSSSSNGKQPRPSSLPPIPTPPPALDTKAAVEQSHDTGSSPPGAAKKKPSKARELIASAKSSLSGFGSLSASGSGTSSDVKGTFRVLRDDSADDSLVPSCNSAGESKPGPRSTFRVGVAEDRNKKCRRTMEDTHSYLYNFLPNVAAVAPPLPPPPSSSSSSSSSGQSAASLPPPAGAAAADEAVDSDNGYFAIFDGHAGTFAADWCGRQLHLVLEDTIRKHPNTPIPELLDMTFTSCDGQLEKLPVKNSGCTAVCAVLRWEDRPIAGSEADSKSNTTAAACNETAKPNAAATRTERQRVLYTANVGDARIVLCRNGKALRLSYDHKGSDENEGKRVANAGGLILNNRVNGTAPPQNNIAFSADRRRRPSRDPRPGRQLHEGFGDRPPLHHRERSAQ